MGTMLERFVADTFRDTRIPDLMPELKRIAPSASMAERLELALLPMLLPALVGGVERVIAAAAAPAVRGFAGGLLTYVYNPLDILGDDGALGLVDDTFVCALGLRTLQDEKLIELDDYLAGICELAMRLLPKLDEDLVESIRRFVSDLRRTTAQSVTAYASTQP